MDGAGSDPSDFAGIYDEFFPKVYNYIRYRVGDAQTADDLVSLAFEKALDRFADFDPRKAGFGAWIFTIARNAVYDHFRGRRQAEAPLDSVPEPADQGLRAEDELARDESLRELLAALEGLDERERELLALKFGADMTNRDIAAHLGLGESNVGVIVFRAVKKLQAQLKGAR